MLTKSIKRFRLTHGEVIVEHDVPRVYDNQTWAIDDKIRLIGISMFLDVGRGTIAGGCENSTINADLACYSGGGYGTERLLKMVRRLFVDDFTIGVATHMGTFGQPYGELVMMFPEGYGIDFEKGDYLNSALSLLAMNWNSGGASASGSVNFYYVER